MLCAWPWPLPPAERPLLQSDDPAAVPIARIDHQGTVRLSGSLDLSSVGENDGLTELLALPASHHVLGLIRGYQPPISWSATLLLLPYPDRSAPPLKPVWGWDLLAAGLPADNWEALAVGPQLSDGRTTLVLASDDNFNPLQSSWIAVMAPRRTDPCPD